MVNEDKASRLKRKLDAVQEIKSMFYIGTSEAIQYIKGCSRVYEKPQELVDAISDRLEKPVIYPATLERVVAIGVVSKYAVPGAIVDFWDNSREIDSPYYKY